MGGRRTVWSLSGHILNSGTWTVQGGEVKVAGMHTLHAGGYVDENDWQTAIFSTGIVQVNGGARFTTGGHSLVVSAVQVDDGGTYGVLAGGNHSGNVVLSGAASMLRAEVDSGSATESGVISGAGSLVKNGAGTLTIQKMLSYTGGTTVNEGTLVLGYGGANGMIRGDLAIREGAQVTLKNGDSFGYSGGNASVKNVNIT